MQETRIFDQKYPQEECRTVLEQTLKEGATKLLQQAIEEEVESYMRKKNPPQSDRGERAPKDYFFNTAVA